MSRPSTKKYEYDHIDYLLESYYSGNIDAFSLLPYGRNNNIEVNDKKEVISEPYYGTYNLWRAEEAENDDNTKKGLKEKVQDAIISLFATSARNRGNVESIGFSPSNGQTGETLSVYKVTSFENWAGVNSDYVSIFDNYRKDEYFLNKDELTKILAQVQHDLKVLTSKGNNMDKAVRIYKYGFSTIKRELATYRLLEMEKKLNRMIPFYSETQPPVDKEAMDFLINKPIKKYHVIHADEYMKQYLEKLTPIDMLDKASIKILQNMAMKVVLLDGKRKIAGNIRKELIIGFYECMKTKCMEQKNNTSSPVEPSPVEPSPVEPNTSSVGGRKSRRKSKLTKRRKTNRRRR
jgi:hypothetical protein